MTSLMAEKEQESGYYGYYIYIGYYLFPFHMWLFGEHGAAVCPEKYQLYRHKCT